MILAASKRNYSMRQKHIWVVTLVVFLILPQVSLAQSADYTLERVAIHARLVLSKLAEPESVKLDQGAQANSLQLPDSLVRGGVFRDDLARLLRDVEDWKSHLPDSDEAAYNEVRLGLQKHVRLLKISAPSARLDINQNTSFSLLLLEMEQAANTVDAELVSDQRIERQSNTAEVRRRSTAYNLNSWGGWNGWGPWGAGCDPWGPYFGRPLNPGYGPYCW
jgi:hypothetical protein